MLVLERLKQYHESGSIVVMHDFSVDRIIKLQSKTQLIDSLCEKANAGGGIIREGVTTTDVKGGNAVNLAYSLAKLGLNITLFTVADGIGSAILFSVFSKLKDKVNLVIKPGIHGLTTAFEFLDETRNRVNVMLHDAGDNADFGPDRINSIQELGILQKAKAVAVVNWATNSKGNQLTDHVFRNSPKALHFIDPADIKKREQDFLNSLKSISEITNVLSINENECNCLAREIGLSCQLTHSCGYKPDDVKNAAKNLAAKIGIDIDLHTINGAAWSNGKEIDYVNAFKVEPRRATGAGDCWNAADIVGHLAGLDPRERLTFANAYASSYVRNIYTEPPTMKETFEFLYSAGSIV
jgi:ribokinase